MASPPPYQPFDASANGLLILWGNIDTAAVDEDALNDWWTNEHLAERLQLPGFQRARRYRALVRKADEVEYLALYETANFKHLASPEYLHRLNHPTERTVQYMPYLAKMNRYACESVSSTQSPASISQQPPGHAPEFLLMIVYEIDGASTGLEHEPVRLLGEHLSRDERVQVTRIHIVKVDAATTRAGSTSKSYNAVEFNNSRTADPTKTADKFIALFKLRGADRSGRDELFKDAWLAGCIDATQTEALEFGNIYELIASMDEACIAT